MRVARDVARGARARRLGLMLGTALTTALLGSGAAAAQEAATASGAPAASEGVEEIVVTGTRIRGIEPTGSAVLSVGQAEIQRSPVATTTDLLRQLPLSSSLGGDEGTSNGGTSVQGASFNNTYARAANLRGLGTTATLVLIDGHRVAPQGQTGQINDLDLIPALALERVEVVADGASAIYGSDAVAGVINLVLRKRFNGATAMGRYAFADDYHQWMGSGVIGRTWGSGSFMMALEHQERSRLRASDRPNLYTDDFSPYGGSPSRTLASPGNILIGGVPYAIPTGQNGQNVTLGSLSRTPNRTNIWEGVDALPQQERNTVLATFSQDLGDRVTVFGEGLYTRRDFERANVPAVSTAAGFNVPASNPFSPCFAGRSTANTLGIACPANGVLPVQYSFLNDLGPAAASGKSQVWSLRGGFDVDLGAEWKATLAGGYSRNRDVSFSTNNFNTNAVNVALAGQATVSVNGVPTVITRPANVPALNLFCGGISCNDPATLNYIRAFTLRPATYNYKYVSGGVDGPLFSLPGGQVRLAAGFDIRGDKLVNLDRLNTNTPTNGTTVDNVSTAERDVTSFYGELFVPLIGDGNARPGFQRLSLSAAVRTEKYSDFGRTTNPKFGLTWEPMTGLDLHASYGTSFRAPTLADINPTAAAVNRVNPLTAAQAVSLGLPNVSNLSFLSTTGGTVGIQPEDAETISFGFDFRPERFRGLRVSVNYYDLTYRNRIDQPVQNVGPINALLARPLYDTLIVYNPLFYPGRSSVTQAQFDAMVTGLYNSTTPVLTGAAAPLNTVVAIARGNKANTGTLNTSGLDLAASYTWDTSWGEWRVGGSGQYVFNYDNSIVPSDPPRDLVNEFSAVGSPMRFKGRAEFGWNNDTWSANVFVNYTNAYHLPAAFIPAAASREYLTVGANTTVDATVNYRFGDEGPWLAKGVTLQLSVTNLFDKDPPLMLNNGTVPLLFDNSNASPIGRMVAFQLSKSF